MAYSSLYPSIAGLITNSLRTVMTDHPGYQRIRNNIISGITKIPLDPTSYLTDNKDYYTFVVDFRDCGLGDELLQRLLYQEAWLQPALTSGDLRLLFPTKGIMELFFQCQYIDTLIAAANRQIAELKQLEKLAEEAIDRQEDYD